MADRISLVTVYDDYEFDPEFRTGFGFSCLVKADNKNILFDTGGDSETLLFNLEKAGIEPKNLEAVIISHMHGDHIGGLSGIQAGNADIKVFLPRSPEPTKVIEGVCTTGTLGVWLKEQALVVETDEGLVVITGCAHPGVVNLTKKAKEITGKGIHLVLGGFHLEWGDEKEIKSVIKGFRGLGVEKVAPCHCSGDRARELFEEEFGEDYIENGVGKIIKI